MGKTRIKNDGFHDVIVDCNTDARFDTVMIRQHGREPATIVVSRSVIPLLTAALEDAYHG